MRAKRVLIGCEFSGAMRRAFRALGHNAWSCDIIDAEDNSRHHLKMDVREALLLRHWDLFIVHPPCTYLAVSGARWFADKGRHQKQVEALDFVRDCLSAPVKQIALENPISVISTHIRKPDQIIQPWQFGHGEVKATCWWLKNLPPLTPTDIVAGRTPRVHYMGGRHRAKERSRTYSGIAAAAAAQWGGYVK